MNHVLILSCSTGEGHNSAARAVQDALQQQNISCEIKDPVSFQSQRMKHLVSALYNNTIRKAPAVFGAVYKLGDLYNSARLPSPVYWANAHYSPSLKKYIQDQGFDAVICTHLYGMEAMTAIRKDPDFNVPCFGVLTDYVCIPFTDETDLTGYFVPNQAAKDTLVKSGIREDRILLTGIPVRNQFRTHPSRAEARKALQLPMDKKIFLIMTGGVGCENMEHLCRHMHESLGPDDLMIVLAGKNQELQQRLQAQYGGFDNFRTVDFTDQVPAYMAASDVVLSKPGGLSSTEAAVANIPIVHIHAIPGCETYNARFFADHGLSIYGENDRQAVYYARILAYDSQLAASMRTQQRKFIHPDAADRIVKEVGLQCSAPNLQNGSPVCCSAL